jgi:hypothetical protein
MLFQHSPQLLHSCAMVAAGSLQPWIGPPNTPTSIGDNYSEKQYKMNQEGLDNARGVYWIRCVFFPMHLLKTLQSVKNRKLGLRVPKS